MYLDYFIGDGDLLLVCSIFAGVKDRSTNP